MYNNNDINTAINQTLDNMRANLKSIPVGLGLIESEYRSSVYDNDNHYYDGHNDDITGCDKDTSDLMSDESDYYQSLICSLTGLKSVNVTKCTLKPVKKTNYATWDKLHSLTDTFVELFRPLWKLSYICDEVLLHQDDEYYQDFGIDTNVIDTGSYNSLFDLYYDLVLYTNNSSREEDRNNKYILKYTAYLRAVGAILSERFDYDEEPEEDYDDDDYDE
jgi:hypothetical protein